MRGVPRLRWKPSIGAALLIAAGTIVSFGNSSSAAPQTIEIRFIEGDVSSSPQSLSGSNTDRKISAKGPQTASIDFNSFNNDTCSNNVAVLSYLQSKNPINGTMEVWIDKANPLSSGNKLAWNTQIEGKSYRILLFQFPDLLISESDVDTNVQGSSGNVEIIVTEKGRNVRAQGTKCTSTVDVKFSATK